jgi:sulfatase maturation enzyme AslB (radical SAM superfamily)
MVLKTTLSGSIEKRFLDGELTQRVKIHTGFGCNENCKFCYYHSLLHTQNKPLDLLLDEIELASELGYKDVDFTGGEPTIVPGIEDAIKLSKELGFRRINVITNGIALSSEKKYSSLVDSGLNETLFSVHGHTAEVHDALVGVPGAFSRITTALGIARDLRVAIRTNITINNINYQGLPEYVNYLLKFEPENMNFIFINPWVTSDVDIKRLFVRYTDAMPYLTKALNVLEGSDVRVAIRYVPYCVVPEEYHRNVVNSWNRKYDPYEWAYPFSSFTERLAYLHIRNPARRLNVRSEWLKYRMAAGLYTAAVLAVHRPSSIMDGLLLRKDSNDLRFGYQEYSKTKKCSGCSMSDLCEGVKNEYLDYYGDQELHAI